MEAQTLRQSGIKTLGGRLLDFDCFLRAGFRTIQMICWGENPGLTLFVWASRRLRNQLSQRPLLRIAPSVGKD